MHADEGVVFLGSPVIPLREDVELLRGAWRWLGVLVNAGGNEVQGEGTHVLQRVGPLLPCATPTANSV